MVVNAAPSLPKWGINMKFSIILAAAPIKMLVAIGTDFFEILEPRAAINNAPFKTNAKQRKETQDAAG